MSIIPEEDEVVTLTSLRDRAAIAYNAGEPIMSDPEFDEILVKLKEFGVEEVVGHGYEPRIKIAHRVPMLSLDKSTSNASTIDSVTHLLTEASLYGEASISIEPKMDGLACSIHYQDGVFVRAAKRGSKTHGEDISHHIEKMMSFASVPRTIRTLGYVELRGEILIRRSDLDEINSHRFEDGLEEYSNPRNTASGFINRVSTDDSGWLSFVAYDALVDDAYADLNLVIRSGMTFDVPGHHHFQTTCNSMPLRIKQDSIESLTPEFFEKLQADFQDLDFDTDGAVLKVAEPEIRTKLGESDTSPRWAFAHKFPNVQQETVLRDIVWQFSRTGRAVPVAIFDPVFFGAVRTTRATLNNYEFLVERDVMIGDAVAITRANDVIPYFVGRIGDHAEDAHPWSIPEGTTRKGRDLVVGTKDPVQNALNSLERLGILGVALATLRSVYEVKPFETILDLMEPNTGFDVWDQAISGVIAPRKAYDAVNSAKTVDSPVAWFAAIGIPSVGIRLSRLILENLGSFEAVANATAESLVSIDGMGGGRADLILAHQETIREWMIRLADLGISTVFSIPEAVEPSTESILTGKNVVVTGTLPTMSRSEASTIITDHGGNVQGSVTKTTDILVAGEKAGSKLAKAQSLGIQIIDGVDFEALVIA